MGEENISQEFRMKNIEETKNYLIKEINQNELITNAHKKICMTLNYTEHFFMNYSYWMYFIFCFCFFT